MKPSPLQIAAAVLALTASSAQSARASDAEARLSCEPVGAAALADPVSGELTAVGKTTAEPFDWPTNRPLVMRATPFDIYRIACKTHEDADLDIALWDGPATDWLFRRHVRLAEGEAVFSTPLGFSRIALKHFGSTLKGCRISRLRRDETPGSWQNDYDRARASAQGLEALAQKTGYEVFSLAPAPDSKGTLSPQKITAEKRAAAAFLISDLGAAPTRFSVLTKGEPVPFLEDLETDFRPRGDFEFEASPGIAVLTFWPIMTVSERGVPVCFDLKVGDDDVSRLCLPTDPLHGPVPDPASPLTELTHKGGVVGKPLHIRLLVSARARLSGTFDRPGRLRAVHFSVLPGWDRVPKPSDETLIALPSRPSVKEPPGPDLRRSAALARLGAHPDRFRMPLPTRRQLLSTYAEGTRTLLLSPSTPPPPGGRGRLRMLLAAFEKNEDEETTTARKDTVWLPLRTKEALAHPALAPQGPAELTLVLERKAPTGAVCRLKVAGKLFGVAPIEEIKKVEFVLPSPAPVSVVSIDPHCEIYTAARASDVPPDSMQRAAKLRTFFALDGRESLSFDLPGPDIPAYVELRVLDARPENAGRATVTMQTEDEQTVFRLAPMHRTNRPFSARHVLPVSAAARKVHISTDVPRGLWIALALRAPAAADSPTDIDLETSKNSPTSNDPPREGVAPDALARIEELTAELRRLPRPLGEESRARACDLLLERASNYLFLAQAWRAKDDLIMAHENARDPSQAEKVWGVLERYRDDIGVVSGLLEREPVMASSPELIPLPPDARIEDSFRVDLSGDDRNLVRVPYEVIWSALPALKNEPESFGAAQLLFLHSVAALHTDWIASGAVLARLKERFPYRPLEVLWLRTLIRASVSGQTVPSKMRLPALSSALKIEESYALERPALSGPIGAMSRWELTEGFTGITRTVPAPEASALEATQADDVIDRVTWEDPWPNGGHLSLTPGDIKIVELNGHPRMRALVEARFAMRPLSNGAPPRCHLKIRSSADLDTRLAGPSLAFESVHEISETFELPEGEAIVSLAFECADPQAKGRVRARLWLDHPLPQSRAAVPVKKGFGHLLMLSTSPRWRALDKGADAELQIKGPTLLRLRYRGSSSIPKAVGELRITSPDGSVSHRDLPGRGRQISETVVNLPARGVFTVRLEALEPLELSAHHRVPAKGHSLIGTEIERPLPEPPPVTQAAVRVETYREHRVVGRLRESTPPGTLWLGIRAETDAVAKERLDARTTPWVFGPEAAFLSRLEPHRAWLYGRSGTRLRLSGPPTNTVAVGGDFILPAGTSFQLDLSGAWQPVESRIESAYRARLEVEHDFALTGHLELTPMASARAAYMSMDRLGDAAPDAVDSTIFNRYLADHDLGLDLGLRLKWRPLWPLLVQLTVEERSNRDLSRIFVDRVEAELDVFAAYEGFVGHLEASVGRRFADADRSAGSTLWALGSWLTYNHWLTSDVSILMTGGGRYLFDLGRYDASASVFAVFNFGRGLGDEPPSRRPLRGALESDRPADVLLENRNGGSP